MYSVAPDDGLVTGRQGGWFCPRFPRLCFGRCGGGGLYIADATQEQVTGTARQKLYKGNCMVVGRKSPFSLYSEDFATFEKDQVYDQKDATGFIRLNALRLRILAIINAQR